MAGVPSGLGQAVALALDSAPAGGAGPPVMLDPRGRIRRLRYAGRALVAKRCTADAAFRERDLAVAARDRWPSVSLPMAAAVVVPEVVSLADGECALVTPDLGEPLSTNPVLAARLISLSALRSILTALLDASIEAPGFVPRNVFWTGTTLLAIDWEDARMSASPTLPDHLTVVKWDIAWSDVLRTDPRLRDWFIASATPSPLDRFERSLAELTGRRRSDTDVRRTGLRLTLASELHVPAATPVSAADLGHLADEVLDSRHSVLHTAVTAYVRENAGDAAYASMVAWLWSAVRTSVAGLRAGEGGLIAPSWLAALCTFADRALFPQAPPLDDIIEILRGLVGRTGWTVACERARLTEFLLARVTGMITQAFNAADLQLLLRGSLSQGVLGARSDVDFELSSPAWPNGHRALERLVIEVLAAFGFDAEGSAARPAETDIHDPASGLTRDAHEWLELRRPGSPLHDPGWLQDYLAPDVAELVGRPSQYERRGHENTAKYLWFETRAALARLVFREHNGRPPVTLVEQLALLPSLVTGEDAADVEAVIKASFALREGVLDDPIEQDAVRLRLDLVRSRLHLVAVSPRTDDLPVTQPVSVEEPHETFDATERPTTSAEVSASLRRASAGAAP